MQSYLILFRRSTPVLTAFFAFAYALFPVISVRAAADDNVAPQPIQFNLRAELLSQASPASEPSASKWQALGSDSNIHSGDVIRYTLNVANTGAQAVSGLIVTQPIPDGTTYILNTARQTVSYAPVTYLVGGATQYAAHPVAARMSSQSGVAISAPMPAPADSYQQVRWTFTQPLPGKTTVQVSYQVLVR